MDVDHYITSRSPDAAGGSPWVIYCQLFFFLPPTRITPLAPNRASAVADATFARFRVQNTSIQSLNKETVQQKVYYVTLYCQLRDHVQLSGCHPTNRVPGWLHSAPFTCLSIRRRIYTIYSGMGSRRFPGIHFWQVSLVDVG